LGVLEENRNFLLLSVFIFYYGIDSTEYMYTVQHNEDVKSRVGHCQHIAVMIYRLRSMV